ncbi:MAG: hypothetical protein JO290_14035 [Sphingomonadaceae bacterium]|nr:hypothetical protein [Sphingomonadaceae bacterium]
MIGSIVRRFVAPALAAFALAGAAAAPAATITVGPTTFVSAVNAAHAGDVVVLTDGEYGDPYFRSAPSAPAITIDGCRADAHFRSLRFDGRGGLTLKCLQFVGGGLMLVGVRDVTVANLLATAPPRAGIGIAASQHVAISDVEVIDAGADGVDIGGSQHVTVDRLACYASHPTPGAHPDCLQLYSKLPTHPVPTDDVAVRSVVAVGDTQGVDMFGNTLPATNVHFDGLVVVSRYPRGVSMTSAGGCTGCSLTNSRVERLRGAAHAVQLDPQAPLPGWAAGSVTGNSPNSTAP